MYSPIVLPTIATRPDRGDRSFIADALCAQTDPEAFFPEKGGSPKEAKQMCARCDVADACLQAAIDNEEEFGVWGGLTARERKNLLAGRVVDERLLARISGIRLPAAADSPDERRLAG
jgi:WhiB family redox-sensing transcriptional regulator